MSRLRQDCREELIIKYVARSVLLSGAQEPEHKQLVPQFAF